MEKDGQRRRECCCSFEEGGHWEGGGRRRNNSTIGIRTEGELRGMANHGCHFQQEEAATNKKELTDYV